MRFLSVACPLSSSARLPKPNSSCGLFTSGSSLGFTEAVNPTGRKQRKERNPNRPRGTLTSFQHQTRNFDRWDGLQRARPVPAYSKSGAKYAALAPRCKQLLKPTAFGTSSSRVQASWNDQLRNSGPTTVQSSSTCSEPL